MKRNRLEAFSDGVIAIIITIMVLEMKVPHDAVTFVDLKTVAPALFAYVVSFVYIAIYWNNHHHLLHSAHKISGSVMWANTHLLFWLSLVPFASAWLGKTHFAANPTAAYGIVLLMAGIAYYILQLSIISTNGKDSTLARAIGSDFKGKTSIILYIIAVLITSWSALVANIIIWLVAVMWLVPDKRIEKELEAG